MSGVKQVKVDNWGIYFLQRLKHFFNRTDYCDLTLQFQDNAQLKVHRLVLSACTEYFELLERTCEMYEDCLVMPDDLQADVVVPIVNFMYTGQLEFRMELLDSLHQTSQIMNMPVLTKLLDAHRHQNVTPKPALDYNSIKRSYSKSADLSKQRQSTPIPSSSNTSNKRSFNKAFGSPTTTVPHKEKKIPRSGSIKSGANNGVAYGPTSPVPVEVRPATPPATSSRKAILGEPRPTRYELPEELDTDNIFDNSFTNISYGSQPLMVHPESTKHYPSKRTGINSGASSSNKFGGTSTVDIVECKKVVSHDIIFDDSENHENVSEELEMFSPTHLNVKNEPRNVSNQLFDQILDNVEGPKVTIETKDNKQANNIDHAKIISEVLKKYPHLVKSNKNIKLKILNTPGESVQTRKQPTKHQQINSSVRYPKEKLNPDSPDFTFETDVLDSKQAARLIAMGAENIKGPWICLICGTPGRALHFTSYYKFRRHLVEIHNEKPVSKVCEYCGLKSLKRNYLLHHLYTKHGVEPPPSYHFPKCNFCSYVALTEGFLVKHKLSHTENRNFRCNVCAATYNTSSQLLSHIQNTGHKYTADRKTNLQCIYCQRVFMRESNLYAHLKTHHKRAAKSDGIIEESDEERQEEEKSTVKQDIKPAIIKYEPPSFESEYQDVDSQYQIQRNSDGNLELIPSKLHNVVTSAAAKQKILNSGLGKPTIKPNQKIAGQNSNAAFEYNISPIKNQHEENIVVIDNNEYIMRDNHLIPRKKSTTETEFIISDMPEETNDTLIPTTSMEFSNVDGTISNPKMMIKKSASLNQPIQIVVSNEEEYKALMNSNHSIIFDDGDTNKTLTLLSAPHTTTINSASMDNTQSNDMMIIQDNYPLNVSEALPTDNPNIVVVYSHPVDDQNKEYQLITSQDIGEQFVESSAVITQNFETITTSAPVMSAHVPESWQSNIQHNIVHAGQAQITAVTEIQEMSIADQSDLVSAESNVLPEVTLTSVMPQAHEVPIKERQIDDIEVVNKVHTELVDNEENTEQIVTEDNMEQVVKEQIHNVSSSSMAMNTPSETVIENVVENTNKNTDQSDSLEQSEINNENANDEPLVDYACIVELGIEEHSDAPNEDVTDEACIVEQGIEESAEQLEENEEMSVTEDTEVVESNSINVEPDIIQTLPASNDNVVIEKVNKEQVRNLASEWSEDEEEAGTLEQEQNDGDISKGIKAENDTGTDIEESIENIQQEMKKQTAEPSEADGDTEESVQSTQDESTACLQEQSQPIIITGPPQEKISSLLNDWEDNDSQEENGTSHIKEAETVHDTENNEKHEIKKDDKIKSLVSDWDDDEEIKS